MTPAPTAHRTVAQIAAEQYTIRHANAQAVIRNGGMLAAQAEKHLRPWLAIACTAGASLPVIETLIAEITAQAKGYDMSPGVIRWFASEEICARANWVPVLARARDDAFDRYTRIGDEPTLNAATALQRICLALQHDVNGDHVPPYRTRIEQPMRAAA